MLHGIATDNLVKRHVQLSMLEFLTLMAQTTIIGSNYRSWWAHE